MSDDLWIFGYGSLLFRPDFPFVEKIVGRVDGHERRFWQASPDHRGTPESPGRVVTLVPSEGGSCWGVAYRIEASARIVVLEQLDYREREGYALVDLAFEGRSGAGPRLVQTYIGQDDNPHFVGPEDDLEIARIVRSAAGPSGHNVEYVLCLADALDSLEIFDPHVLRIANLLIDPDGVLDD